MPNHKYSIGEMVLNPYTVLMNLTIRSLEKGDFGGYICKSSNALGKAEGTVRLQGRCYWRFIILQGVKEPRLVTHGLLRVHVVK